MGTAKRYRWPTRLGRRLAAAGDNGREREEIEKDERRRWLEELRGIMRQAGAPVVKGAGGAGVELVTDRLGKGRRALTLRKHVKVWNKVRWL